MLLPVHTFRNSLKDIPHMTTTYTSVERYSRLKALDLALNWDTVVYYFIVSVLRRNPEYKNELTLDAEKSVNRLIRTGHIVRIASEYADYKYYINVDYKPLLGQLRQKRIQVDTLDDLKLVFEYIGGLTITAISNLAKTIATIIEVRDPYIMSKGELSALFWNTWIDRFIPDATTMDRDGIFRDATDTVAHLLFRPNPLTFLEIRNRVLQDVEEKIKIEETVGVHHPKDPTTVHPPKEEPKKPNVQPDNKDTKPTPPVVPNKEPETTPPETTEDTNEVLKRYGVIKDDSVEVLLPLELLTPLMELRSKSYGTFIRALDSFKHFDYSTHVKINKTQDLFLIDRLHVLVQLLPSLAVKVAVIKDDVLYVAIVNRVTYDDFALFDVPYLSILYELCANDNLPCEFRDLMTLIVEEESEAHLYRIEMEMQEREKLAKKRLDNIVERDSENARKFYGLQLLASVLDYRDKNADSKWDVIPSSRVIIRKRPDNQNVVFTVLKDEVTVTVFDPVKQDTHYKLYAPLTDCLRKTGNLYLGELVPVLESQTDIIPALKRIIALTGEKVDMTYYDQDYLIR